MTHECRHRIVALMYEARHAPLASRGLFARRLVNHFGIVTVVIAVSLAVGMGGYRISKE